MLKVQKTSKKSAEILLRTNLIDQLRTLTEIPSVSGNEQVCGFFLKKLIRPLANRVYLDRVGNVIVIKGKPKIFIFVHMDSIGFLVSSINNKSIQVVSIKEKSARPISKPWKVQILTSRGPIYCQLNKPSKKGFLKIKLPKKELNKINIGDPVALVPNFRISNQNLILSQGLDNKLGILIAIETLKKVTNLGIVATVQEETTGRGALKAAWDLKPNSVIVLDTTYDESQQKIPGPRIGKGPSICLKDSLFPDQKLVTLIKKTADKCALKLQYEVLENGSSDANRIHNIRGYTPFVFLGIPIKNMHSPNETGSILDVENTIKLLTNFVRSYKKVFK